MRVVISNWRAFALAVLSVVIVGFAACTVIQPPPDFSNPPSASDKTFEEISRRYLAEMLPLTPVQATSLGEHRYDSQLDDVSADGQARRVGLARQLLAQMATLNVSQMSRPHQVDAKLLESQLKYVIWSAEELQEWRWNPLVYTDLAGNSIYLLLARDFAPLPARLHSVAGRLSELPRLLQQVRESLDPARVPRIHAETAIKQNTGVINLIDELVVPQLGALPEAQQTELKATIATARTAVAQHQIWLEKKLLPLAAGDFRLGAARYDTKLQFALDSPLSRQEIRARAQSELKRVRGEMYDVSRAVLAGRSDAPPLPVMPNPTEQQAAILAALELAYEQHPARNRVFETAQRAFEQTTQFVEAHDLVTVYDDPIQIIPMPEFQRGVAVAFCDSPGPLDKGQKTFFAVSPIPNDWSQEQVNSWLREYNTRSLYDLTIHEAMPGHYLQLMHANRYDSPLRAVLASGSFIEGWAVYTEGMMVEEGFLNRDPLMHLIQLKWYLRVIGNAILDQAVHVDGISREDAMQLMMHDTFQQEREAAGKWVRAQLTAAQLPTYFVGAQEHMALRAEAKDAWGKEFTLKRYHDAVLSYGSPPVRYVRELMLELPIQ
ncbi:MAG: DUF885 domain-containing protein [Proteobacteria bacterium]|nr:DUF885 domain-containing protein [Pseudomonadota bacterium]